RYDRRFTPEAELPIGVAAPALDAATIDGARVQIARDDVRCVGDAVNQGRRVVVRRTRGPHTELTGSIEAPAPCLRVHQSTGVATARGDARHTADVAHR